MDLKSLEASVKNKFKWSWLEEDIEFVDSKNTQVKRIITKINVPGVVCCLVCSSDINYASAGRKAVRKHLLLMKHIKAFEMKGNNEKIDIVHLRDLCRGNPETNNGPDAVALVTFSASCDHVSVSDRICLQQAAVLSVVAEHSVPCTMAPVLIELAKSLAKHPKAHSRLSIERSSAHIKCTGSVEPSRMKPSKPFAVRVFHSTSMKRRVPIIGKYLQYWSATSTTITGVLWSSISERLSCKK